ncbi:MAG: nucleotidyltransferase family protein [Gammaproteobacteria bacterium]|nr:nucleotidyltransferase family protein [Gammaproteobacteria bacterium]
MPVQSKDQIISLLHRDESRFRALGVKRLGLFGSFARGEQRADSDIDILVEFEADQKTFDRFITLGFSLEELLGRRVDLITIEAHSPYLGPHILAEVEYVALAA